MALWRSILHTVHEWLAPSFCLGCDRTGAGPLALCPRCNGQLKRLRPPRCRTCARRFGAPGDSMAVPTGAICGACRRRGPALDRLYAVWSYEPPMDAVLRGLKFRRLEVLGSRLASALIEPLRTLSVASGREDLSAIDRVVPVPLHWRRHIMRGYNQAERIARPLARHLGLPCTLPLVRRLATPEQARLARRERWTNLRGAFRVRSPVTGEHVLLVDDVVTTGATLEAAARALLRAGASRVTGLAAARTPGPGEPQRPPLRTPLCRSRHGREGLECRPHSNR